ncbi:MAG: hypothetical protein ACYC1Z_01750 [Georgenia sp.]
MTITDPTPTPETDPLEGAAGAQESPEAPAAAAATPEAPEAPEADSTDSPEGEDETGARGGEAAKYRRRLRQAETERDELRTTVDGLRRTIAESALGDVLAKPAALWLTGTNPADYYGEDGNLNIEALTAAAQTAVTEHGLAPATVAQVFDAPSTHRTPPVSAPSWQTALSGR